MEIELKNGIIFLSKKWNFYEKLNYYCKYLWGDSPKWQFFFKESEKNGEYVELKVTIKTPLEDLVFCYTGENYSEAFKGQEKIAKNIWINVFKDPKINSILTRKYKREKYYIETNENILI